MERDTTIRQEQLVVLNFNSHAHVERDGSKWPKPEQNQISTHTLTWSVTISVWCKECMLVISTHTLTWSVTPWHTEDHRAYRHFNSHAHVERDQRERQEVSCWKHFNSHAHVERDRADTAEFGFYANFNSHAHVERDLRSTHIIQNIEKFQLTRSRGAWLQNLLLQIQF